ncbi:unnamed protein product [Bubo scandiacus]
MLHGPCVLSPGPYRAAKAQVWVDVAKLPVSLLYASSCNSVPDCSMILSWEEVDVVFTHTAAQWGSCSGVQERAPAGSNAGMGQVGSCEPTGAFLAHTVSHSIASPIPSEKAFYFSVPLCKSVFVGSCSISSCQGIIRWGA